MGNTIDGNGSRFSAPAISAVTSAAGGVNGGGDPARYGRPEKASFDQVAFAGISPKGRVIGSVPPSVGKAIEALFIEKGYQRVSELPPAARVQLEGAVRTFSEAGYTNSEVGVMRLAVAEMLLKGPS